MAVDLEKLRGMSPEELVREEKEVRDQIWKLRLQAATGQTEAPRKARVARRDLARILTVRRERERATTGGVRS